MLSSPLQPSSVQSSIGQISALPPIPDHVMRSLLLIEAMCERPETVGGRGTGRGSCSCGQCALTSMRPRMSLTGGSSAIWKPYNANAASLSLAFQVRLGFY